MQMFTSLTEEWRQINGFPGYEVSNLGRVRSFVKSSNAHVLRPSCNKHRYGYMHVNLIKNKRSYTRRVHRLVAEAFVPNPENKPEVNHIDCNTSNNNSNNLEWVTPKENSTWKVMCGRAARVNERSVVGVDPSTGITITFQSLKEAERQGFHRTAIRKCIRGEFTQHKGLIWSYATGG